MSEVLWCPLNPTEVTPPCSLHLSPRSPCCPLCSPTSPCVPRASPDLLLSVPSSSKAMMTRSCSSTSRKFRPQAPLAPFWLLAGLVPHHWGWFGEDRGENPRSVCLGRFTGSVKLKGVIVMGEDDGTHPAEMRL